MNSPKVSVIVPVYNGAPYLAEAIQSVLDQTFSDFELIVVSDASPDESALVIKHFDDRRIVYIEHPKNRGANAARNTGACVSSGEILAFLDQDDLFHRDKLAAHVAFLERNPDIGFSYNGRFELLSTSSKTIRDLWRPPQTVTLADMVLGFPFGPSEMVIRRDWFFRAGLWDEGSTFAGGEIDLDGRLWMEGCGFGCVDRALTYRRPHAGKLRNLSQMCAGEIRAREKVFADPRCPMEIQDLRNVAGLHSYLVYAYHALAQEETELGQELVREATRVSPTILDGNPCELISFFTAYSILDEAKDLEAVLNAVIGQIPPELAWLAGQYDWATARGYLLKGIRAMLWGRSDDGRRHFRRAGELKAEIDEGLLRWLVQKLLDCENELGRSAANDILKDLAAQLEELGGKAPARWLRGCYLMNQALDSYQSGELEEVPHRVLKAIFSNPKYVGNRGAVTMLIRSALGRLL